MPEERQSGQDIRTALIDGETFKAKPVQYAVVGDLAMFEGDIVLGRVEEVERSTEEIAKRIARAAEGIGGVDVGDEVDTTIDVVESAAVVVGTGFRWPGGVVPFEIDPTLPSAQQTAVQNAIRALAGEHAALSAAAPGRRLAMDLLLPGPGCSSPVGRQGVNVFTPPPQNISLAAGCMTGQAIHEVGHSVGLWHEQSREDRDTFVTINFANIQAGQEHNFNQHISDGDDVGAYDFGSIMHYGPTAFGRPDPAGSTHDHDRPESPPPARGSHGTAGRPEPLDRAAVAWMYPNVYPSPANTWTGRFRGAPTVELLYYAPARRRWFLSVNSGGRLAFRDIAGTATFGDVTDGRPFGSATSPATAVRTCSSTTPVTTTGGSARSITEDPACAGLRTTKVNLQRQISAADRAAKRPEPARPAGPGGDPPAEHADRRSCAPSCRVSRPTWATAPARSTASTEHGRRGAVVVAGRQHRRLRPRHQRRAPVLDRRLHRRRHDRRAVLLPGRRQLVARARSRAASSTWSLVGNTAGFGHAINDGRPFWIGDFTGNGSTDVLFYYPGDDNWWLGHASRAASSTWSHVGNTAGFGHAINDGRPFWIGDFTGNGSTDVLFYYPGDDNWWLGTHPERASSTWSFVGNTAGFGHAINDGRPFWIGDFTGDGSADVLFYFPGDDNWWLGQPDGRARRRTRSARRCVGAIAAARTEIRSLGCRSAR